MSELKQDNKILTLMLWTKFLVTKPEELEALTNYVAHHVDPSWAVDLSNIKIIRYGELIKLVLFYDVSKLIDSALPLGFISSYELPRLSYREVDPNARAKIRNFYSKLLDHFVANRSNILETITFDPDSESL